MLREKVFVSALSHYRWVEALRIDFVEIKHLVEEFWISHYVAILCFHPSLRINKSLYIDLKLRGDIFP